MNLLKLFVDSFLEGFVVPTGFRGIVVFASLANLSDVYNKVFVVAFLGRLASFVANYAIGFFGIKLAWLVANKVNKKPLSNKQKKSKIGNPYLLRMQAMLTNNCGFFLGLLALIYAKLAPLAVPYVITLSGIVKVSNKVNPLIACLFNVLVFAISAATILLAIFAQGNV